MLNFLKHIFKSNRQPDNNSKAVQAKHRQANFVNKAINYLSQQDTKYVNADEIKVLAKYSNNINKNVPLGDYEPYVHDLFFFVMKPFLMPSKRIVSCNLRCISDINRHANKRNHVYYYDILNNHNHKHKQLVPHYLSPVDDKNIKLCHHTNDVIKKHYKSLLLSYNDKSTYSGSDFIVNVKPVLRTTLIKNIKSHYHIK